MVLVKEKSKKRPAGSVTDSESRPKRSKTSSNGEDAKVASVAKQGEVDFPRGGGTSFTAAEYKTIRSEALKEMKDGEVFKNTSASNKLAKSKKKQSSRTSSFMTPSKEEKRSLIRVEHLNYKRLAVGMRILCQIVEVRPYSLIVSLPGQLLGHIPITNVSRQWTEALEALADEDEEDEDAERGDMPELHGVFIPGQFVRAIISVVKPQGTTDGRVSTHLKDNLEKASRRVELSLIPDQVNSGVSKTDLVKGMTMSAAVKSVEDHGYLLDIGLSDVTGFLKRKREEQDLVVGSYVDLAVDKLADDGRTCIFTSDPKEFKHASVKEISSSTSILPGLLVQGFVTNIASSGLILQVLGSFGGTIDLNHLSLGKLPSDYKIGQKIKARILYDVAGTSPPQFVLSLRESIKDLRTPDEATSNITMLNKFPVGSVLSAVKVKRVEPERGLMVEVDSELDGFVHISSISDEHIPSLAANSGNWKIGSVHQARVTGSYLLDGLLQLSIKPSVLTQSFLRVDDVTVGDVVKGTVKKLTDSALFVSLNGSVDGIIWPTQYADIALKHPQKRFKQGATIKCRVLAVDAERKRIELTAKKTLVESELPIVTGFDGLETGTITHAFVSRVLDKSLIVEFYNHIRAIVPARETSETPVADLSETFSVGKPLKVCLLSIDREASRLVASVRLASEDTISNIKNVQVGQSVSGSVSELHDDNAILTLYPEKARALISLRNIANARNMPLEELKKTVKEGERIEDLVVVSRNLDKGILVVASRPSAKTQKETSPEFQLDTLTVGEILEGRVTKHSRQCAIIKYSGRVNGALHLTDVADDFSKATLPAIGVLVKACVLEIDREKRRIILSTRASRSSSDSGEKVEDREIGGVEVLQTGQDVRGFVKSITDHGIFVALSRNVDARVQIKELYDDFVKDWKQGFKANQLVKGIVLRTDMDKKQVEMSLRSNAKATLNQYELTYNDLQEGQVVEGKVKKVEDFGVFVNIDKSKLSGLCHKSEIADDESADVEMAMRNFRIGDKVKAVVLSVDKEKRRISLGLKPSYFSDVDMASADDLSASEMDQQVRNENDADAESQAEEEDGDTNEDVEMDGKSQESDEESALDLSVIDFEANNGGPSTDIQQNHSAVKAPTTTPVFSLNGFQWDKEEAAADFDASASSSDESDSETEKRPKKKKKQIEQDLTADMQTRMPQSVADYERHLLASPNSSYLWLQYMSFQLQLAEIDKAREIGKRALEAISIREEQEKLNVWIGLLNLENTYGTEESLEALFKDAARHNDSKTIHLRMADIFEQSEKFERAEEQYKRTCKKFGRSAKVWTLFGEFYMRQSKIEEARKLLPRSLQSLEKRKHLKVISKFALLEYKHGEAERGKTIFEGIIDSHKKRWDLWSIYMDMEAGQKNVASVRNLFERLFTHKMTNHKAKSFFKKWLEIERRIGDEDGQQIVKEKAMEWARMSASS